jgi:hypothetical protein
MRYRNLSVRDGDECTKAGQLPTAIQIVGQQRGKQTGQRKCRSTRGLDVETGKIADPKGHGSPEKARIGLDVEVQWRLYIRMPGTFCPVQI